jgi:RimJ/RimL family protein N-acetyltransferase
VIRLLLAYAFGCLSFHRVAIGVVGFNERAIRFYEKIGFKRGGLQRDGYFYDHRFYDFVMMSILEDECLR